MAGDYRGLVGAFLFALRRSPSWFFRSYVVVSAILGGYVAILLGLAAITWIANPVAFGDRAFLGVIGLFILVPLFTPVLVIARRYRRKTAQKTNDQILGVAGYVFILSILLALFITDPQPHDISGPLGIIAVIDSLPREYGLIPPLIAIIILILVTRFTRPQSSS